jgi:hypothetical protein
MLRRGSNLKPHGRCDLEMGCRNQDEGEKVSFSALSDIRNPWHSVLTVITTVLRRQFKKKQERSFISEIVLLDPCRRV